jgi:hypothetical protein
MKKTVISTVAQFSLPDTWTPPDQRRHNDQAHLPPGQQDAFYLDNVTLT